MASIELYNDAAAVSKIGSSLVARMRALRDTFDRWNEARATRKALYALSLRELDDIGIAYGDIKNIR
ncbi:MAG: DUF1127 domain-containing protein [Pseudomonadota bacterium]